MAVSAPTPSSPPDSLEDDARSRRPQADDLTAARVGAAAFALLALWRVTVGIDFGDGAHAVAQALRWADGDVPFVDEMNLQMQGSLLAVPFTWAWRHVAGVEGIVLASRVWYVVIASLGGWLSIRALRTAMPAVVAVAAVASALVPTPYNLLNVSYNTVPGLGLLVGATAGFAATKTGQRPWAVASGLALVLAAFSHPAVLPASAVMMLALVALAERQGKRLVTRSITSSAVVAAAVALLWLIVVVRLSNVLRTFRYTADYQSLRAPPVTRLKWFVEAYGDALIDVRYVPLVVLVAAACVRRRHVANTATALIPLAAAAPSVGLLLDGAAAPAAVGATIGTFATILVFAWALPVTLWSMRTRNATVNGLLLITLPAAIVSLPVMAMTTSAAAAWGATVAPLVPLLCVQVAGVLLMWSQLGNVVAVRAVALTVVLVLAGVQSLYSFRNGTPWNASERVGSGPNAGLSATPGYVDLDDQLRRAVATHVGDDDTVLFYVAPAGYITTTARMDTNIVWLGLFREANQATVDWFERSGRHPTVAFVPRFTIEQAGSWDALMAQDPLIAYLRANSAEPIVDGSMFVLRRLPR
jgi:hypothetical protein